MYGVYYILHVLALVLKPRGRTQSGFSVAGCCVASAKMTWSSVGHTYQQKKTPPRVERGIRLRMQWRCVLRNASQKIRRWPWANKQRRLHSHSKYHIYKDLVDGDGYYYLHFSILQALGEQNLLFSSNSQTT